MKFLRSNCLILALTLAFLLPAVLLSQETPAKSRPAAEDQLKLIKAVENSLVKVEITLQYDKGEPPRGGSFAQRCPYCGQYHTDGTEELVKDERPFQAIGYLIAPNLVLTPDLLIHPRFIKSIAVRSSGGQSSAKPYSYLLNQNAMILGLDQPLPKATPLAFSSDKKAPFYAISSTKAGPEWTMSVETLSEGLTLTDSRRIFRQAPDRALIVDAQGVPITITTSEELPPDDSWKTSPLAWPALTTADYDKLLATLRRNVDHQVFHVTLNFRTPRNQASEARRYSSSDQDPTTRQALAIAIDPSTLLVLAELKPAATARLERIRVHLPDSSTAINANFKATLTDYGALIATTEQPLPLIAPNTSLAAFEPRPALSYRDHLLPAADITLQGEKVTPYFLHERIANYDIGWRQNGYPEIPSWRGGSSSSSGQTRSLFLYDTDGHLLAFPITQREKTATAERYSSDAPRMTMLAQLLPVLANLAKNSDTGNIPLSAEEESRLAWLGVELQPLTSELARANNVSDRTNDGENGALVTFVYPQSPAAAADIQVGDVLLRLNVASQPKPLDVHVDSDYSAERAFPWDRLSELPEEYFDRIPTPWSAAENTFTRQLTDLGFGTKFTAELSRKGQPYTKELAVTESPRYWDSAPKFKFPSLGVTVKEITYEVQRYFQRKPADPGVIIGKIELGSKASVAGLKPYEIITHVNDTPVASIADFERLTKDQSDLRLTIRRMTRGRIVNIQLTGPAATAPATSSPAPANAP